MFVVQLSYGSTLQLISERCRLPLLSTINEVGHDGSRLHGIEMELPALFQNDIPRRVFFWSSVESSSQHPYEDACLQAIIFLQSLYRFTVLDYNYHIMMRQQRLIGQLLSLANRGAQLARIVVARAENEMTSGTDALHVADRVIEELDSMLNIRQYTYVLSINISF
jgi:hypothetical protein